MNLLIETAWELGKQFKIQQKELEWKSLLETLLLASVKNIIEIGSYDGGTTISLAQIAINLTTVEILPRYDVNHIKKYCNFEFVRGSSFDTNVVNRVRMISPISDFLFIDGDHSYEGVKRDFENYRPFVKSGGLIAFHDIVESDSHKEQGAFVFRLWKEIKHDFKYEEYFYGASDWGGIGVLWMP